jgi:hypothetical protein
MASSIMSIVFINTYMKKLIWAGEELGAVMVDNHPDLNLPVKTIMIHVFDFAGTLTIEGSLVMEPTENDWFVFREFEFVRPTPFEQKRQSISLNTRDNIMWMRAKIDSLSIQQTGKQVGGRVDRVTIM